MVAQASSDPVKQKELSYEGTVTKITCVVGFPLPHSYMNDATFQLLNMVGRLWLQIVPMEKLTNGV